MAYVADGMDWQGKPCFWGDCCAFGRVWGVPFWGSPLGGPVSEPAKVPPMTVELHLDVQPAEKPQVLWRDAGMPDAPYNFPPTRIDPIWPEVRQAVVDAMAQRSLDPAEPAKAAQFQQDLANIVRTKLFHDGSSLDYLSPEDMASIFNGAPKPRLGTATMNRRASPDTFKCFDSALEACGRQGTRYFIALLAAHSTQYSMADAKFIMNRFRELPFETLCAIGLLPDDSLAPQHVRVSIITA